MTPHAMAAIQGNSERRAQKRLRPSTKSSILVEAKGSALASDHSTENEVAREPCQLSAPGVSLKEAADTVVRCLTPFYKEGRFTSKVSRVGLEFLGQCRGGCGWQGVCTHGWKKAEQSRPGLDQDQLLPSPYLPCPWGLQGSFLFPLPSRTCLKALPAISHTCWLRSSLLEGVVSANLARARRYSGGGEERSCCQETGPYFLLFPFPKSAVKQEAQSLIKQFFHDHARCESEADWHGLCGPQR